MGMHINIDQFRHTAGTGMQRVVAQQGELVRGTQSWLGRAVGWLTGSTRDQNRQVMAQLRDALSQAYGVGVAVSSLHERFGASALSEGKPLSSRDIRMVLDTAAHRAAHEARIAGMFTGLAQLPGGNVKATMNNAISNLGITLDVLAQSPSCRDEVQDYRQMAQSQKDILRTHLERLNGLQDVPVEAQELLATVKQEVQSQLQQLDEKLSYVDNFDRDDPVSEEAVAKARAQWTQGAVAVLNEEITRCRAATPPDNEKATQLEGVRDGLILRSQQELDGAGDGHAEHLSERLKNFPKELETTLKDAFERLHISTHGLHGRLNEAHIKELNEHQQWATISKDVRFAYKGQTHLMQSEVRPACEMGAEFRTGPGRGICCQCSTEATHAVNLWETSLKSPDGQTLFHGIRHGIHSAYGMEQGPERTRANLSRATETVKAVLVSNPRLLEQARNAGPHDVVRVPMTSISLVTPDAYRYYTNSKHSNERQQLFDQTQAWQALNAGPIQMEIDDGQGGRKTVTVQPDIIPLNFGVNQGALGRGMPLDLAGGWSTSTQLNQPGLERLLGSLEPGQPVGGHVGEFLAGLDQDDPRRAIIGKLCDQIRTMWQDGSYKDGGAEPYKMVKRLAVLSSMVDGHVLWNCKSGKDRTGELDAEAKHLAAQIALDGDVPEPDHDMGPQERHMFREFAFHSANLEIQRLNTGVGGFKTGFAPVTDQLGDERATAYHRGGSSYVKA